MKGIEYIKSPPYHPPSNEQAENSVRSFDHSLEKIISASDDNLDSKIKRILYISKNTSCTTFGKSPYDSILKFGKLCNMYMRKSLKLMSIC